MTSHEFIRDRIQASILTKQLLLAEDSLEQIARAATVIKDACDARRKVFLFGNGGSAADAQHIAAELGGKYYLERRPLPAIALTTNTSLLTALGNDFSFDEIFARQIQAEGHPGDVAIGLSTSGASENVRRGLAVAKKAGLITMALTGRSGGQLNDVTDECIRVPSDDVARIQEAHILIGHILCEFVERSLFGSLP